MHDRTDTIRLPADVARCEPSGPCVVRGTCARYQAAIPKHGGSMADFSVGQQYGGSRMCPGYLNSHEYRNITRPTPKPRVFGPLS